MSVECRHNSQNLPTVHILSLQYEIMTYLYIGHKITHLLQSWRIWAGTGNFLQKKVSTKKKSGYGWIWIWPNEMEWSGSQNFVPWRALAGNIGSAQEKELQLVPENESAFLGEKCMYKHNSPLGKFTREVSYENGDAQQWQQSYCWIQRHLSLRMVPRT